MRSIVIVLSLLLAGGAASAAEVYKWKDKDGRLHYGDKPKTDAAEALDVEPSSGSGEPSKAYAETAAREKECKDQKAKLDTYKKAQRISAIDSLGKERVYTPAEREQFLALTQKKVDEVCTPKAPSAEAAGTFPPPEAPPQPVEPPPEEPPASRSGY
jgi:flagellar motility protein MotE (MotC chaperone)